MFRGERDAEIKMLYIWLVAMVYRTIVFRARDKIKEKDIEKEREWRGRGELVPKYLIHHAHEYLYNSKLTFMRIICRVISDAYKIRSHLQENNRYLLARARFPH